MHWLSCKQVTWRQFCDVPVGIRLAVTFFLSLVSLVLACSDQHWVCVHVGAAVMSDKESIASCLLRPAPTPPRAVGFPSLQGVGWQGRVFPPSVFPFFPAGLGKGFAAYPLRPWGLAA